MVQSKDTRESLGDGKEDLAGDRDDRRKNKREGEVRELIGGPHVSSTGQRY
jgi:hypothetical protein